MFGFLMVVTVKCLSGYDAVQSDVQYTQAYIHTYIHARTHRAFQEESAIIRENVA